MTREELEEGRRLLQAFDALTVKSTGNPRVSLSNWLIAHASDLLSLAEEARWRSVDERPADEGFVLAWCEGEPIRRIWFSKYVGFEGLGPANYEATHWRPLPKPPEKP